MRPSRHESRARTSGPLGRALQSARAVEAERDVEAFDALARGAFDQVVERRGDHCFLSLSGHIDQAQVRVASELGCRRSVDDSRERLVRIERSICVLQLLERTLEVEIARGEDPPGHGYEMGDERDSNVPSSPLAG